MHSPPDVQHVHQVLQDYNLLNITMLQDTSRLDLPRAKAWRMNLCAASEREPGLFFVAMDYSVLVYRVDHFSGSFGRPVKQLVCNGDDLNELNTINQLKVSQIFEHEAIVTVNNSGEVWIWRTDQLDGQPIVLNNNHSSTWGLAIHSGQGLIAVSANNWQVTVFNMHHITASSSLFGKRRPDIRPVLDDETERIHLIGHTDNIPCVDFNRSGRFLASCSIDQTCRIWDLRTQQQVTERQIMISGRDSDSWCWSVKFVSLGDFKGARCTDERLCEKICHRIAHGRSTGLSSLHLRHSAPMPVYRVNLPAFGHADVVVSLSDSEESYGGEDGDYEDGVTEEESMHFSDEEEGFLPAAMLRHLDLGEEWRRQRDIAMERWDQGEQADLLPGEQVQISAAAEGPTDEDDTYATADDDDDDVMAVRALGDDERDQEEQERLHEEQDQDLGTVPTTTAVTVWDPSMATDYDTDWFGDEEDDENDAVFMLGGPNGSHRLLSPAEHRILRERLRTEQGPFRVRAAPTAHPIPVSTKGGWSDNSDDDNTNEDNDERSQTTQDALEDDDSDWRGRASSSTSSSTRSRGKRRIVPHTMRSSNVTFYRKKRRFCERLMLTTPRDLFMLRTSKGRMVTERMERNVVSSVDVRSDRLLVAMDRLNMVQWIPELELFIAASQKGTVALMRILQVGLQDDHHTPMFNHERYLPDHDMQRRPLYGMTCFAAQADRHASPVYILYLFYCDGAVLGYRISRQNDELFTDPIIL